MNPKVDVASLNKIKKTKKTLWQSDTVNVDHIFSHDQNHLNEKPFKTVKSFKPS